MAGEDRGWALVTGATSGIGRAMLPLLARRGFNLVLAARSEEELSALEAETSACSGVRCRHCAVDLSLAGAASTLDGFLSASGITVRVLINNAGVGRWGDFASSDPEAIREQIGVNVSSLVEITRRLAPSMTDAGEGWILNVASTAAFAPGPRFAVYYATKAFVLSFSEAIREEFAPSGIRVSVLCPGETVTGFQERAGMQGTNLTRTIFLMDAETVARAGIDGLFAGKAVIIPGIRNKMQTLLIRLAPRAAVRKIVAGFNSKR